MHNVSIRRRTALALLGLVLAVGTLAAGPAEADSNSVGPISRQDLFVDRQYQDFLGRKSDDAGRSFWVGRLKAGASGAAVVEALATSPEFEGRVAPVVRLYYAYFGRSPDFDGLNFWVGKLGQGGRMAGVSQAFAESAEFQNTYGSLSAEEFVDLVYQNVLGRSADDAGRDYWLGQMAAGASRGAVMLAFSDAAEYRQQMDGVVKATMLYVGLLRRQPDEIGLEYWAGVLSGGGSYRGAISGFLASAEYRTRVDAIYDEIQPLTGERTEAANTGRALAVKVDNIDSARPQKNLHIADIVIEEEVEFQLTRFIAFYHSELPAIIGPTRSARTTDFGILGAYNQPVLSSSGGNPIVLQILSEFEDRGTLINRNEASLPSAYFRDTSRRAPHNLYARTATIMNSVTAGDAPQSIFSFRPSGIPSPVGTASNGVRVDFGRNDVSYIWDPAARGWQRWQNGSIHKMDDGTIIAPDNVVVQEVKYITSIADADTPEAVTTGTGRVHVFTDGKYISGTWSRAGGDDPTTLTDDSGAPILLTPGETWVALARPEQVSLR